MASQDFVSTVTLSDDQKASLMDLEPAFEHLLRDVGLEENTILALRHCRIKDRETFTGLADAPEELRSIASDLGIDLTSGGMPHKREFSKVLMAWKRTKVQTEVKTSTEALQRQHGEPVRMLPEDWTSVIVKFKSKYGSNLQEEELPAQAYFEEFQEKLAAGMLQAEPLDQVISQAEAEEQDRKKPDPPRQYGMHLNATLTIQTRRRYTSSRPKNLEELRQKYDVLSNCWLLGQQRQPGRALYSDVDSNTFPRILKELLGKNNFSLQKELEGQPLVAPPWGHCLSYEYELRREAYKRCWEQCMGFNAAWWGTYADTEHRMLHWLQLVSLANSVPQVPPQTIASLVQKEVAAQLKRSSTDRSRTPRLNKGSGKGRPQLAAPQQLAHQCRQLLRNKTRRVTRRQRARDHQQARYGPCVTFSAGVQRSRACFMQTEGTESVFHSRTVVVRTLLAYVNTSALVAAATVVTTSASACSPSWLPFPERALRLLLINSSLLLLLRRAIL